MEIASSRQEAKATGAKRYWSHCRHHGDAEFWTSNACCTSCTDEQRRKYQKVHADKLVVKRRQWDEANPKKAMLQRARSRARTLGVEFDLTANDFEIPDVCPALGIPLERRGDVANAPSLDRVHNDKGYVRGNAVVVSMLANRIKNNATLEQLRKVVDFYDKQAMGENDPSLP